MTSKSILLAALACLLLAQSAMAAETRNVLVLYSNNRLVPGNVAVDRGLRATLANGQDMPVQMFSEFLDLPEFGGSAYEETMTTYLRQKYVTRPPSAIVVVTDSAFEFVLRHRDVLFPGVPVVHVNVARSFLQTMPRLPADVIGVPMEYDFSGTVVQALRWHPDARTLLVVTGASDRDRGWEARLRRDLPAIVGNVKVEFLAGLPTAAVLERLGRLGADTVVFTPGYFQDGERRLLNPRDAASAMAAASTAPMYGPFDTFIGVGVVGGRMPSFEDMGRQAGRTINELFAGVAPSAVRVPADTPTALRVDWRQVKRWGIDESLIPADAAVQFREPTFWEMYRNVTLAAAAVMLLQAAAIVTLVIERRRRRAAELAVQQQRGELAHASRLAVAGELTASIAHEINQPLGAVQTSADTLDMILASGGDRREDLLRIVTRIRRDNLRASDVIRKLRTLLAKHEPERHPFDLNAALSDAVTLLNPEAARRNVVLEFKATMPDARVQGDHTQIQQVLINLILNAMDAVMDMPDDRRTVVLSIEKIANGFAIAVRDRGPGILPEYLPRLFESFFSTKQKGMGLGLSIARTIIEAHGGRIRAENGPGNGATFYVELPASGAQDFAGSAPA